MLFSIAGSFLKVRQRFQDEVILIELGKQRGDLSLAKCIVKCIVDCYRRDTGTRSSHAIDHKPGLRTKR